MKGSATVCNKFDGFHERDARSLAVSSISTDYAVRFDACDAPSSCICLAAVLCKAAG